MKTKQTIEREQQEMDKKQTVESEQPVEVIQGEKINTLDNKNGENASPGKGNILKRIWAYVLQNPTGTGTLLLGAIGVFALIFRVILPNTIQIELKLTSEDIGEMVQSKKSGKFSQVEKFLQKVEGNPKASLMNKAVVEAHRLKQVGKLDDSIEKWRSIANIAEGNDNDLAAGAWFAVGALYMQKDEKDEDVSVYTCDKSIFLPGYLDKPFLLTISDAGQYQSHDVL